MAKPEVSPIRRFTGAASSDSLDGLGGKRSRKSVGGPRVSVASDARTGMRTSVGDARTSMRTSIGDARTSMRTSIGAAGGLNRQATADLEASLPAEERRGVMSYILQGGFLTSQDDAEEQRAAQRAREKLRRIIESSGQDPAVTMDVTYFPDPPCIQLGDNGPAQDGDEKDRTHELSEALQVYWKQQLATWLDSWPLLAEDQKASKDFAETWASQKGPDGFAIDRGSVAQEDAHSHLPEAHVVICENPVAVRSKPVADAAMSTDQVVHPGQMVMVVKTIQQDDVSYLGLHDGGWLFDTLDGYSVMAQMRNLSVGSWWFRVVCDEALEVCKFPSYSDPVLSGWVLSPDEITLVDVKARVYGRTYLHLADGRGWVPELRQTTRASRRASFQSLVAHTGENETEEATVLLKQVDAELAGGRSPNGDSLYNFVPATDQVVHVGKWSYSVGSVPVLAIGLKELGVVLNPGERVKVDKTCYADGEEAPRQRGATKFMTRRKWLRLSDGRGWVPEIDVHGKDLMKLETSMAYPSFFAGVQSKDLEDWRVGFV